MNPSTTFNGGNAASPDGLLGQTADRAHQAVDRAVDKAAPVLDRAATAAHRGIDKAADAAAPAAEWATRNGERLATTSRDITEAAGDYVRERPLFTIAAALAAGYFAGKLMR